MIRYEIKNLIELRSVTKEVEEFLTSHGVGMQKAFDARLVLNELAGNVLKHASSTAWVTMELGRAELHLTVYAQNGVLPPQTSSCPEPPSEGGRGLFLVDTLSVQRMQTPDGGVLVVIEL